MKLKLSALSFKLQFRHAFHIAHGNRTSTDTVITLISDSEHTGYGEAALPPYLGYTAEKVCAEIIQFSLKDDHPSRLLDSVHASALSRPAKASLDIALHDLWAKQEKKSLHALLGLPLQPASPCFYTLGISPVNELEEKLAASAGTKVYKIKLGGENDEGFLKEFRKRSQVAFCADANQAWKSAAEASEKIKFLADMGCLFIEQPLPAAHPEYRKLFTESALPLYLDESIQSEADISANAANCNGINIKLVKCGGIRPALSWINTARTNGLSILSGCMSECSCGAAAALQISGYSDYVDLDGPLLISNDPFKGLTYSEGLVSVNRIPGTGIEMVAALT